MNRPESANNLKPLSRLQRLSRLYGKLIAGTLLLVLLSVLVLVKVTPFEYYENEALGFRMKYPAYWRVQEYPQGVQAIVFVSPPVNDTDRFFENVNVTMVEVPDKIRTIRAFSRKAIRQVTGTFEGMIEIVQSRSFPVAGRSGHLFIFVGEKATEPVQYMHVWVLRGQWAYVITYTALEKDFENYHKDVLDMIKSFQFI